MKLKLFGFFFLLSACLSCSTSTGAKQAKIYQDNLETMLGKEKKEIVTMVTGWDFGMMDLWEADNPDAETINEHNRPKIGFSKKEIQEIFAAKGKYNVMTFQKKIGTDSATVGQIDQFGMGLLKDTEYTLEHFTIIRAVFRDDNLVSFRVWPDVTSRDISGLRVFRRD